MEKKKSENVLFSPCFIFKTIHGSILPNVFLQRDFSSSDPLLFCRLPSALAASASIDGANVGTELRQSLADNMQVFGK